MYFYARVALWSFHTAKTQSRHVGHTVIQLAMFLAMSISTSPLRLQGGHGNIDFVHEAGDVILHADIAMKLFG